MEIGIKNETLQKCKPIQVPAMLDSYKSTVTKGVVFSFSTQENISPELLTKIIQYQNKLGWLSFNVEEIELVDIARIAEKKIDKSKYKGKGLEALYI